MKTQVLSQSSGYSAQLGKKATDQISSGMGNIVESTQGFAKVITELNWASTQINEVTHNDRQHRRTDHAVGAERGDRGGARRRAGQGL